MTISTSSSQSIVAGNSSTYTFDFTFVGDSASDITISYIDADGIQTELSPSQYTLVLNAASTNQLWGVGGTVTYPLTGPAIASGTSLLIKRTLPLTQQVSIQNQGNFYAQVTEQALDILEMQIQQVAAKTGQIRGVWITDTQYNFGDIVQDGANGADTQNYYMCAIANVSDVWATDLSAGDWSLVINIQQILSLVSITNDNTTNAFMYPVWVTASTGYLPLYVSSQKMAFDPASASLQLVSTSPTFSVKDTSSAYTGVILQQSAGIGYLVNQDNTALVLGVNNAEAMRIAPTTKNLLVGTFTDDAVNKLQVSGSATATKYTSTVSTGTAPLIVASTTRVSNLNAATCGNADTVTTNANLTGPITSVGNATSIASQTGTGTKFVVDTSPIILTPTIAKLANLTTNGYVQTSGGDGTLSVNTAALLSVSPRNALINGAMRIAQAGTSFTGVTTGLTYTLDGWGASAFGGNATASQQTIALTNGFLNCLRLQRPNGNTATASHLIGQSILTVDTTQYAGQACVLSFYARCGANFSPASSLMVIRVATGTGTNEGTLAGMGATYTGFAFALNTSQIITTSFVRYTFTLTPSSTATEMCVNLSFNPTGTAGAADYMDITGVQLELGTVATVYEFKNFQDDLDACLPFYTKTFPYATAPAQNAGVTGALTVKNPIALGDPSETWHFKRIMRSIPTITTYNPSATNANWRDITAAGDATVSVNPGSTLGTDMVMIATSGTVTTLGDILAIHATADSRI